MLLPELRAYIEMPGDPQHARAIALPGHGAIFHASLIEELLAQGGVVFEACGEEAIDGHRCVVIAARRAGEGGRTLLYAAAGLDGLVIRAAREEGPGAAGFLLRDISLKVPASLLAIPEDYSRLAVEKGEPNGGT
jgi:hypothetical protein